MASGSRKVVYAALAGNLLIAATKAAASAVTGSSAMLSEAVHSLVDTGNEALLLYGMHRSGQPPDTEHPLGSGRELYFWSFVVALLVFALGAGVSFYEGVVHLQQPRPIERPMVNYVVLGLSLVFEGASWWIALHQFIASKGTDTFWRAIVRSKDPPQFMVLLEDSAALAGILIALAGTWAAVRFGDPRFDGFGSIAIGLLLAAVSVILARESKGLLIGERADPAVHKGIVQVAGAIPGIRRVNGLITTQLAPQQIVAAFSVEFEPGLDIADIERIVQEMETAICRRYAEVTTVFVKPQSHDAFTRARRRMAQADRWAN
jgi:cation diffusion facilitator family transporter